MNINAVIQPAGFVLPVSLQLFDMLMVEAGEKPLVNIALPPLRSISGTRTTARSGRLSPGGNSAGSPGDEWCLDYATDFGYVGNAYPELEKIIDISWSQGYVWHCRTGDLSPSEARALYTLWERNFLSYHASGVYITRVLWES